MQDGAVYNISSNKFFNNGNQYYSHHGHYFHPIGYADLIQMIKSMVSS